MLAVLLDYFSRCAQRIINMVEVVQCNQKKIKSNVEIHVNDTTIRHQIILSCPASRLFHFHQDRRFLVL